MRLKQLYLKGFKSFANETVINFNEDVIGIVGPNGSGKSNIVDAIRWVLGEQKGKDLRLESMSDVIFNGSKKKKKGSIAHVAISFENTKNIIPIEYNTVTISRLLYRNGDSEYRLNDIPCRLKDIQSLLVDTGIGSNSYAIIALGMVDDILNNKNNARRRMFEQASGIIKYKTRKRETILKLNNTQLDLERVEDLLSEIESNLKSLEKQARRTERYYKLKENYKELSIQHAVLSTSDHLQKSQTLKETIQHESDALRQTQIELNAKEAKLQERRVALLKYEETLSDQQRKMNTLLDQIRDKENQKNQAIRDKEYFQKENQSIKTRNNSLEINVDQIKDNIAKSQDWIDTSSAKKDRFNAHMLHLENQLKNLEALHQESRGDLDEVVSKRKAIDQRRFNLEKEIAVLQANIDSLTQNVERRESEAQENEAYASELTKKSRILEADLINLKSKLEALKNRINSEKLVIDKNLDNKEKLQNQLREQNRSLDAKQNEFDLISAMVKKMEGSTSSIQFLSNQNDWKNVQLLGDVLDVTDEYRTALESYLEPYIDYYIVQKLSKAYTGIELLGQSQKGKAQFFVLDLIESTSKPKKTQTDLVRALDTVKVDAKYAQLVNNLLADVYILPSDKRLQDVALDSSIIILASDGSIIKKGAEISGGSVGLFEGKRLGRKKQLEKIEARIKKDSISVTSHKKELASIDQFLSNSKVDNMKQELLDLMDSLHQKKQEKITVDINSNNLMSQLSARAQAVTESQVKENAYIKSKEELLSHLSHIELEIEALSTTIGSKDEGFKRIMSELTDIQNKYNESRIESLKFDNQINEKQRDVEYNQNRFKEITTEKDDNAQNLSANNQKITGASEYLKSSEAELLELYSLRKSEADELNTHEKSYYGSRDETKKMEDAIRTFHSNLNQSQSVINQLKEEHSNLKLELSSFRERLRVEFEVDLESISKMIELSDDIDILTEKVGRLRSRLQNYGEINPMAVEAYKEIEERYNSIKQQRDDVLDAKESLLSTIKEIEIAATTKFMTAFDQVRLHFIDAFRSLFSEEDNCDLILLDPNNPLESEIEIVAKPKGKRPKSLSQLSGGEKTLTATALLFALYLLKPAPFCIFDEVDAPLDDANIEKFNKIVKRFSEDSQFIVVTHNKQTMAAVDVIYGVYMESQGISNLSQVDFRSYEHNEELIYS